MTGELTLQTGPYRTTFIGTEISRPSTQDEWRNYGEILRRVDEAKQWAIGDWLVDGKSHYGDGLYEEAARITGLEEKTLSGYASISDRMPITVRNSNLTHAHHAQVASIKKTEVVDGKMCVAGEYDEDAQQKLLFEASREIQRSDGRTRQLTVKELREQVQRHKQQQEAAISLYNAPEKYDVIYADPPWEFDFPISGSRKIETHHYPTMPYEKILELQVPAADDAVCFVWAPASFVHKALGVLKAWGFEYRTTMVWVKDHIGLGQWVRARHEFLFIGTRGDIKTPADADKPDSVLEYPRREHSQKPDEVYEIVERMFPELRKIELFARNEREGWSSWGDELNS